MIIDLRGSMEGTNITTNLYHFPDDNRKSKLDLYVKNQMLTCTPHALTSGSTSLFLFFLDK